MPKHKSPRNIHRHESPPLQYIDLTLITSRSLLHPAHSEPRHFPHCIVPVLQQERPAERSCKKASASSMLFRVSHGEQYPLVGLRSEFVVPLRFAEAAANTMDGGEAFDIADGDFIG